ncbi:hypothetical protein MB02_11445 [Croceicoccus estronivorus]|uniref:hypothetical protein n=1 Tax=Croceicoccus estronivorus TaxID=1172626 RepID=UPI00082C02F9|nr:hypothetical protein [Croceicoccus estronivorus]OCC23256.1 hypothetical protein MB02_11445 [Croceicoccus estronivorus]
MHKFLIATPLALAAAAILATPATAATGMHGRADIGRDIAQLDRQIDRAEQRDLISWREATRLHKQVDRIETLHARYARGGFTNGELRILNSRVDTVKRQLHLERSDRNNHRR